MNERQFYVPERQHIVWLDFEPTKGKEIGKYRPALILSSRAYNKQTGLIICCPISTSIRGHLTEVIVTGLEKESVIATSIIQTLSWPERKIKYIKKIDHETYEEVLKRIIPLIGAAHLCYE